MIKATKFDGTPFYINPHLMEFMEATPDTVIRMMSDRKILVKETPEKIAELIIEYRMKIGLIGNDTPI